MRWILIAAIAALGSGPLSAQDSTDPNANRLMANACGFPLSPTNSQTNPLPVGDGKFYYVSDEQLAALKSETFEFDACEWNRAAREVYNVTIADDIDEPEEDPPFDQELAARNAEVLRKAAEDGQRERIARHQALIGQCGFPRSAVGERTIRMNVGDGTYYYVSNDERRGITNPASGFKPCRPADQTASRIASTSSTMPDQRTREQQAFASTSGVHSEHQRSLIDEIDAVIREDSRSWLLNRYTPASVRNVRTAPGPNNTTTIEADYTFNRSRRGWIRLRAQNGQLQCITYHDFPSRCRAVGDNPALGFAVAGVIAAGVAGASSGGTPAGSSSGQNCRMEAREIARADGGPGRIDYVEVCN